MSTTSPSAPDEQTFNILTPERQAAMSRCITVARLITHWAHVAAKKESTKAASNTRAPTRVRPRDPSTSPDPDTSDEEEQTNDDRDKWDDFPAFASQASANLLDWIHADLDDWTNFFQDYELCTHTRCVWSKPEPKDHKFTERAPINGPVRVDENLFRLSCDLPSEKYASRCRAGRVLLWFGAEGSLNDREILGDIATVLEDPTSDAARRILRSEKFKKATPENPSRTFARVDASFKGSTDYRSSQQRSEDKQSVLQTREGLSEDEARYFDALKKSSLLEFSMKDIARGAWARGNAQAVP